MQGVREAGSLWVAEAPSPHPRLALLSCAWTLFVLTDAIPQTLGQHLKRRRLEQGLLQRELDVLLGVSVESVRKWETTGEPRAAPLATDRGQGRSRPTSWSGSAVVGESSFER